MAQDSCRRCILVVGDNTSAEKARGSSCCGLEIDLVGSLAEALEKQASGCYEKLIVDTAALGGLGVEFLKDNPISEPQRDESVFPIQPSHHIASQILDTVSDAYFSIDKNWRFTYLNAEAERHFQLPARELLEKDLRELLTDVVDPIIVAECGRALNEGIQRRFDIFSSIQETWYEAAVYPSENGILVHLHENTEHKRLEDALRKANQEINGVLERISEGFVAFDHQWRYVYANGPAERIIGCNREQLLGHVVWDLFPESIGSPFYEACMKADTDRIVVKCENFEERLGVVFENVVSPSQDGVSVFFRDITEQKRVENALRASEERFRTIFDCGGVGMVISHNRGRVCESNRAFQEMLGYTAEELQGMHYTELTHPDDLVAEHDLILELVSGERKFYQMEKRYVRKDGVPVWATLTVAVLRDAEGVTVGSVCIIQDINDRKIMEQELAKIRVEAERRAAELESFVSSIPDGVVLFDAEPKVLMVNEVTEELLGVASDTPFDVWINKYELLAMNGSPINRTNYPSMRALRGEGTKDARFRMVTPWRESQVSISAGPVKDVQGQIVGGVLTFRDITGLMDFERQREELLDREHHIAETLQQSIIPSDIPEKIANCRIAAIYQPALKEAEIGGDFYDVFPIDEERYGILIGDVAGKGLQAAIRVAAVRYSIRSYAMFDPSPGKVLTLANNALCKEDTDNWNLMTAFFAVMDSSVGVISYSSAGHEPPVICGAERDVQELYAAGLPLGIIADTAYPESSLRLSRGQRVVMVTDGIVEARNSDGELFTKARLIDCILRCSRKSAKEFASALLEESNAHAGGHTQDDVAIVVIDVE